ncbi:hypothetical protein K402DRAFT_223691 [Aulographum hederae CBS 113979]|uniref:Uncharacterized protein n=1 Tax=Aulographum hederae CBS 113979 TaxID=1176131 RepID=A0A6G1GLV4_9PEZI|nr:hypothetical protein K402DRAFT_223691 [Aulographum hederae CBS 113979]
MLVFVSPWVVWSQRSQLISGGLQFFVLGLICAVGLCMMVLRLDTVSRSLPWVAAEVGVLRQIIMLLVESRERILMMMLRLDAPFGSYFVSTTQLLYHQWSWSDSLTINPTNISNL